MRLWKPKTEEVKHPGDQVELAGHPQVKQEIRRHIPREIEKRMHVAGRYSRVLVHQAISQEMHTAERHEPDAALINLMRRPIVILPPESIEVDDGEEWKSQVRQQEEISQRSPEVSRLLTVPQIVHVQDQPEHEHRP